MGARLTGKVWGKVDMGADDYPEWDEFMRTCFATRNEFPMLAPETPSFMAQPIAATREDLHGADVVIIVAAYSPFEAATLAGDGK